MMKSFITLAAVVLVLLTTCSSDGAIVMSNRIEVDFTDISDATSKATWSDPEHIAITENGLGWDGVPAASRDGWIQTKPLAVGLSWRPTFAASFRVVIRPLPAEYELDSGQKGKPYGGDVYVRYSPDLKHWSAWQVLQQAKPESLEEKENPGRLFSGSIRVPYRERQEYSDLIQEYSKMDVPWKSDEEAAVQWILKQDPDFFSRQLPFMGYVEILFEWGFQGGQRIQSLIADVGYGMGGMHMPPSNPEDYKERDMIPWRFKADEQ